MNHLSQPSLSEGKIDFLIQKAILEKQLLDQNEKVIIGLSGGADSIMLTHYLKFALHFDVVACHINHQLRGEESHRDMQFVEQICNEWQISLKIYDLDVTQFAKTNKLTIEQAGRHLRYETFQKLALEVGAQKIATAHTLSDTAETILFNLARGTGLKGLCGIPVKRDNIVRPLSYLTRQDIEKYCKEHGLSFVEDSTNKKTVYTRNKIRHEVIPKLVEVNPSFDQAITKTVEILSNEQDFLMQTAKQAYAEVQKEDGLCVKKLATFHKAIRHRVLLLFLEKHQIEINFDFINKLDFIVLQGKGKLNVKGSISIQIVKQVLSITDSKEILGYFEQELELGEFIAPNQQQYTAFLCNLEELNRIKKVYKKLLYIALDYDKIIGKLIIRQRKAGDSISLTNRVGTRYVKKLFIDNKFTAVNKSCILIVADDQSVVAVEEFGCDRRVACDQNTKQVLVILKGT